MEMDIGSSCASVTKTNRCNNNNNNNNNNK